MRLPLIAALLFLVPHDVKGDVVMTASWYGARFEGKQMASGKPFRMHDASTVAHKTLPFGCILELENPKNNRVLISVVRDRGPYAKGRALDLSYAAAETLGFTEKGVTQLRVHIVHCP